MEVFTQDDVSFYPVFGELMSDGRLRVPTSSRRSETGEIPILAGEILAETGGRLNGRAYIEPQHPLYEKWLDIIRNKEQHLEAYRKSVKEERAKRRRTNSG